TFGWASLVRVAARAPVPIGANQLVGWLAVAALLALVAVLGLVALGQSNSRGTGLRRLQQQGGYEQLLLTDATHLRQMIDLRLSHLYMLNDRPARSDELDLRHYDADSYQRGFLSGLDQQIGNEFARLCVDAGVWRQTHPPCPRGGQPLPPFPPTLHSVAPSLSANLVNVSGQQLFLYVGSSGMAQDASVQSQVVQSRHWAAPFATKLATLTATTRARADALVAADRRSYNRSRDLLIGAGTGSLLFALAPGLLLSHSLVAPLPETPLRLGADPPRR